MVVCVIFNPTCSHMPNHDNHLSLDDHRRDLTLFAIPDWNTPRFIGENYSFSQRWKDSRFFPSFRTLGHLSRLRFRLLNAIHPNLRPNTAIYHDLQEIIREADLDVGRIIMQIGEPGPRQKYCARLISDHEHPLAIIKFGYRSSARARIEHEASMLDQVPKEMAPAVKCCIQSNSLYAIVMEYLSGKSFPATLRGFHSKHKSLNLVDSLLNYLRQMPRQESCVIESHPAIQRMDTIPQDFCLPLRGRYWPVVMQHGDFAPWNLILNGSRLKAIDWEVSVKDGFPYFDLVHFCIQTGGLIHHWRSDKLSHFILDLLMHLSLSLEEAKAILRLAAKDAEFRFRTDPPDSPLRSLRQALASF